MKFALLTATLFFGLFASTNVFAGTKEVGGGCTRSGILCDLQEDVHAKAIPEDELNLLLLDLGNRIAANGLFVTDWLQDRAAKRFWVTTTERFNFEACAPQTAIAKEESIDACQTRARVYFQDEFWSNASSIQKENLVLHELAVSFILDHQPMRFLTAAPEAVRILLTPGRAKQSRLMLYENLLFPYFMTTFEHDFLMISAKEAHHFVCDGTLKRAPVTCTSNLDKDWARPKNTFEFTSLRVAMAADAGIGVEAIRADRCSETDELWAQRLVAESWALNLFEGHETRDGHVPFAAQEPGPCAYHSSETIYIPE